MDSKEKYIAKNIRDHREEIDMDDLWAGVSAHVPKEKKKKRIGFWIFGGFVLLFLISIGWVMNGEDGTTEASFSALEEKRMASNINNKENQNIESAQELTTEIINKAQESQIERTSLVKSSRGEVTNSKAHNNGSRTSKVVIETSNSVSPSPGMVKMDESSRVEDKDNSALNTTVPTGNQADINVAKSGEHITGILELEKGRPLLNNLKPLEDIPFTVIEDRSMIIPEIDVIKVNNHNSIAMAGRWDFYLLGGASGANRKLESKSTELLNERNRRADVVDVIGAWEVEGGFGFRLTPKLKIRTGLNYTQIHEKATFESDYFVEYEVQSNSLIQRQDGSVENIIESSSKEGLRHSSEIRYNQLSLWQIPVRLSYEILTIGKFKFNGSAMASYSLAQEYKGFTSFSASQESYDLELDEAGKFKSSGTLSYGLFLESSTHLTRMLDLSIGFGYRRIGNTNSETYLIDQQYNLFSITSGLSHRF